MGLAPIIILLRPHFEELTINLLRPHYPLRSVFATLLIILLSTLQFSAIAKENPHSSAQQSVTLIFTNDFESAYDPIDAFWRDDIKRIGGIAHLATLIEQIRNDEENVFLFDAGDIFTGTLAKLTKGELPFELMLSMNYDAMSVGNHEFEYGWQEFAKQKNRVSFPVLGANLFYKGTDHSYTQPYTIIERGGIRIGVIGILGQDAATALIPSNIAGVEVRDPKPIVKHYVKLLRPQVDLVVLLTHQGKTAPMQTDDEAHDEIQRDIQADIDLAGVTDGIDILFGGHADAGTRAPIVHKETGTLIMQTYGQGYHLGYLKLVLNKSTRVIESHIGKLITVDSDRYPAQPKVLKKLTEYRARYPEIYATAGHTAQRLNRQYNVESDLGNLYADIVRDASGMAIGLMPSGALRKDLPEGDIRRVDLLDSFPFTDRIAIVELSGTLLLKVLEQGLSLERGMLQVSGLKIHYDPSGEVGKRIISVTASGTAIKPDGIYRVATLEILAQGGDAYKQFKESINITYLEKSFAEALSVYFAAHSKVSVPERGRLIAQ